MSLEASSKRGYNAKKRNEAAQIAAQNGVHLSLQSSADTESPIAQLMPSVSYPADPGDKGKEKAGECRSRTLFNIQHLI